MRDQGRESGEEGGGGEGRRSEGMIGECKILALMNSDYLACSTQDVFNSQYC